MRRLQAYPSLKRRLFPQFQKKKLIFLIFGTVKRKNPRAVEKKRRILDQNLVVLVDQGEKSPQLWGTRVIRLS